MSNKVKKILNLEDLERFYENHKRSTHFSSEESGYKIAVHIPTTFEVYDDTDDTMLFVKSRVFHIGLNRNKSSVTENAAIKAMKTMAYKPLLANFTDINGELDFTSHDMRLDPNDEDSIIYDEKQIGCITADEPWFEYDEELDKKYVCAYVAIPREYTKASEVIERKNGTKVSVELLINDMQYDCKEKCLQLNDVTVQGLTALGTNPDTGELVEEGMYGSKITLKDFSEANNSMFSSINEEDKEKLIEMRETINGMLSRFDINKQVCCTEEENLEKGGNVIDMDNEEIKVVEEVAEVEEVETTVIVEDNEVEAAKGEVTETESTEEVTETVTEVSEETVDESTPEVIETNESDGINEFENDDIVEDVEDVDTIVESDESDDVVEEIDEEFKCKTDDEDDEDYKCKKKCEVEIIEKSFDVDGRIFSVKFELSHDDIRYGLYTLLEKYESVDNDWYDIKKVYDNHFIMEGWCTGKLYGQKYTVDGESVAFDGERYELFCEYLTESEKAELESMRSNYSLATDKLAAYEKAELDAQKEEILADANYVEFAETNSFKEIKENIENYSLDELRTACDLAFAKEVKVKGAFALHTEDKPKATMFAFGKIEQKSSFLDGLLGK